MNNEVFNRSLNLKIFSELKENFTNQFSLFFQKNDKGIPGQSTDYMYYLKAKSLSSLYYFLNKIQWNLKNSILSWENFFQKQSSHYKNLETDFFHKYNSKNFTDTFSSNLGWKFFKQNFHSRFMFGLRIESYKFDDLLSSGQSISRKYRKFYYFSNSSTYSLQTRGFDLKIIPNFRFDSILNDRNVISTILGLKFIPHFIKDFQISLNAGNSYRMPEFTSLFWKGDSRVMGNPDLKPEHSKSIDGKIEWKPDFGYFSVSGFVNRIEDLIFWSRSALGIWKPENLADAEISGIKGKISLKIFDWLSFSSNVSRFFPINKTRNSDHYNKFLINKPLYKIFNKIEFSKINTKFIISNTAVGEQYDNIENTVDLDGYSIFSARFIYSKKIEHFKLTGFFSIKNIFNKQYDIFRHIPAPGRNYEAKIQIKYK